MIERMKVMSNSPLYLSMPEHCWKRLAITRKADNHIDSLSARMAKGADSPVVVDTDWNGPAPPVDAPITVRSRAACDRRSASRARSRAAPASLDRSS